MRGIKLGFLTVHGDTENHSKMMSGVFDAAKVNNADVIRFATKVFDSEPDRYNEELNHLYNLIEAQKLDGLMFLGWMAGLTGKYFQDFHNKFSSIPIFSVGSGYNQVPFVYAHSEDCIRELIEHLVVLHGYQRIIILPPSVLDMRISIYIEVMTKYGLYNKDYVIENDLLSGISFEHRMKRLLEIILDERKIEFDAVIVMYDTDATNLIAELENRGINVPRDVAVASYEDTEYTKFAIPPLTTTTFPWREIGYQACEKLIKIINHEEVPYATPVKCKLIIRNSCGCNLNQNKLSINDDINVGNSTDQKFDQDKKAAIIHILVVKFPNIQMNFDILVSALLKDFELGTTIFFIKEFEEQLLGFLKLKSYIDNIDELEDFIYSFSKIIKDYFVNSKRLQILFEEIIHKAQAVIKEKAITALGFNQLQLKRIDQDLHRISQYLISAFSVSELMNSVEKCLLHLNIPGCYIYKFDMNSLDKCKLIFKYANHIRIPLSNEDMENKSLTISDTIIRNHSRLLCELLCVSQDFYGFIVYEPAFYDERIFHTFSLHISSALKCAILLEQLNEEISLRKEKENQLLNIANYDSLTGLYNRRFFYQALNSIIDQTIDQQEEKAGFYLLFIDVDGFKQVNDKFGHDIGDDLLNEVAKRLVASLEHFLYLIPDTNQGYHDNTMNKAIFRLGGDEFTALVSRIDIEEMSELAYKVIEIINKPYQLGTYEINISCSIGISIYPSHADTAEKILRYADRAMYRAKKQKNMFYFYEKIN